MSCKRIFWRLYTWTQPRSQRERHGTRKSTTRVSGAGPWPRTGRSTRSRRVKRDGIASRSGAELNIGFLLWPTFSDAVARRFLRRIAPCRRSRRPEPSAALPVDDARRGAKRSKRVAACPCRCMRFTDRRAIRLPRRDRRACCRNSNRSTVATGTICARPTAEAFRWSACAPAVSYWRKPA